MTRVRQFTAEREAIETLLGVEGVAGLVSSGSVFSGVACAGSSNPSQQATSTVNVSAFSAMSGSSSFFVNSVNQQI